METSITAGAVALQAHVKFQTVDKELFGSLIVADVSGEAALNVLAIGGSAGVAAGYDDGRLRFRAKVSASLLFGAKLDTSANVNVRPLIQYVSTIATQTYLNALSAAEVATRIGRYAYDWGH